MLADTAPSASGDAAQPAEQSQPIMCPEVPLFIPPQRDAAPENNAEEIVLRSNLAGMGLAGVTAAEMTAERVAATNAATQTISGAPETVRRPDRVLDAYDKLKGIFAAGDANLWERGDYMLEMKNVLDRKQDEIVSVVMSWGYEKSIVYDCMDVAEDFPPDVRSLPPKHSFTFHSNIRRALVKIEKLGDINPAEALAVVIASGKKSRDDILAVIKEKYLPAQSQAEKAEAEKAAAEKKAAAEQAAAEKQAAAKAAAEKKAADRAAAEQKAMEKAAAEAIAAQAAQQEATEQLLRTTVGLPAFEIPLTVFAAENDPGYIAIVVAEDEAAARVLIGAHLKKITQRANKKKGIPKGTFISGEPLPQIGVIAVPPGVYTVVAMDRDNWTMEDAKEVAEELKEQPPEAGE